MSTRTSIDVGAIVEDPLGTAITVVKYGFGVIVCLWMLFPVYWMVSTSFKNREAIMANTPTFIPLEPTISHYVELFSSTGNNFALYMGNSFIVASAAVLIGIVIGVPAAYSLSRMDIPGGHHISFWILSTRMVPPLAVLVPLYILFTATNLTGSLIGLTITHFLITLPMIIWIVKGFIDELPESMEESAMIDGCNRIQAFREIVIPLVMPGIAAAAFISFIFSWNNYMLALVLTGGPTQTAPLAIQASTMGVMQISWGTLGAAATVTVLPVILISLALRDRLVEGLTMGAVKE